MLVFVPALGAFINFFWGERLGERVAGYIAVAASVLTFIFSLFIYSYLSTSHGLDVVVNPFPFFDGWIRMDAIDFAVEIPWQFRVDALTGVMLLVVTGVGSLIHIYSVGYIHGDAKATRFFAYLNLFLMFMLVLVTGNNFLMMFVGWEGVGLCSFLLIGYWWDKPGDEGWKNANAARKAMIANRIGDFGILMAVFLIFWTFGTLDYGSAGETINPEYQIAAQGFAEDSYGDESQSDDDHGGYSSLTQDQVDNSRFRPEQLGVFGQTALLIELDKGEEMVWGVRDGEEYTRGRAVDFGPFTLDFKLVLSLIVIFMLIGAAGKSAQIPLFVWLPDAMAGPTPVSALMHAATMVTAGVYLLVRSSVFLDAASDARALIAIIGTLTALAGGYMALGQWDIKRVLAYSTVSQLGFMVAAVGIGAYIAAVFHLVTHAVFKALLFLGSGSIIHGVEHGHHHAHEHGHAHEHEDDDAHPDEHHDEDFDPQDMRNMGGLANRMPVTFVTYLAGTFALAGLPIFAGFWSKDEILAHAWDSAFFGDTVIYSLAAFTTFGGLLIAAGFTAFYMWRQIQMVFYGEPRSEAAAHAPESNAWMTIPLGVLAVGATFIGLINVPDGIPPFSWFYPAHAFGHFLEPAIPSVTAHAPLAFNPLVGLVATALAFGAIYLAHTIYAGDKAVVDSDEDELGVDPLYADDNTRQAWRIANARLYWDDIYDAIFIVPYERFGRFLAETIDWDFWHDYLHNNVIRRGYDSIADILRNPIDIGLIDGIVNGVGKVVNFFSGRTRGIQTGYVRTYAVALFFGVVAVIVLMLLPLLLNGS